MSDSSDDPCRGPRDLLTQSLCRVHVMSAPFGRSYFVVHIFVLCLHVLISVLGHAQPQHCYGRYAPSQRHLRCWIIVLLGPSGGDLSVVAPGSISLLSGNSPRSCKKSFVARCVWSQSHSHSHVHTILSGRKGTAMSLPRMQMRWVYTWIFLPTSIKDCSAYSSSRLPNE